MAGRVNSQEVRHYIEQAILAVEERQLMRDSVGAEKIHTPYRAEDVNGAQVASELKEAWERESLRERLRRTIVERDEARDEVRECRNYDAIHRLAKHNLERAKVAEAQVELLKVELADVREENRQMAQAITLAMIELEKA